ncbi:hypothetical protein ANN_23349 [Periplaneta americana]|uniref:Uncharacterized protein n=1 Tax=Periplaneta americana TaxID=6978 RepID=A0ABQ8SLA4_PERAM|nr:hypothetical protein ANN_23349 [Periplaneta americana]
MAGLCEGGNEPPGSLKSQMVKGRNAMLDYKTIKRLHTNLIRTGSVTQQKGTGRPKTVITEEAKAVATEAFQRSAKKSIQQSLEKVLKIRISYISSLFLRVELSVRRRMLQFFDVFVMQFDEEDPTCGKDRIGFFIMTMPQHIGRSR